MSQQPIVFDTSDHRSVINAGGLLLIEREDLEDLEEESDTNGIAAYEICLLFSPTEALQLAAHVEQHRAFLEARAVELGRYFTEVATALLDAFEEPRGREMYWWPQVRHQALQLLHQLVVSGQSPVIAAWYTQSFQRSFPNVQQEVLLMRFFKNLYYKRYHKPVGSDEEPEEE
jgi:hypothetical protein